MFEAQGHGAATQAQTPKLLIQATALSQHYSFDCEPGRICRDLASDLCEAMRTVSLAILWGLHIQLPPSTTCKAILSLQLGYIDILGCLKQSALQGTPTDVCTVHRTWDLGSVRTNARLIAKDLLRRGNRSHPPHSTSLPYIIKRPKQAQRATLWQCTELKEGDFTMVCPFTQRAASEAR